MLRVGSSGVLTKSPPEISRLRHPRSGWCSCWDRRCSRPGCPHLLCSLRLNLFLQLHPLGEASTKISSLYFLVATKNWRPRRVLQQTPLWVLCVGAHLSSERYCMLAVASPLRGPLMVTAGNKRMMHPGINAGTQMAQLTIFRPKVPEPASVDFCDHASPVTDYASAPQPSAHPNCYLHPIAAVPPFGEGAAE